MRLPEVVLKDAAAYIEKHGWCQTEYQDIQGRVCMMGAIGMVVAGTPDAWDTHHRSGELVAAVEACHARTGTGIPWYNDAPGRTKDEVLRVLRGDL